jgi:soluble lytic murein transglycosylase-like protein
LQEYNNKHKHKYNPDHLFLPEINKEIARWYLNVRIPQMIKHYGKPVTKENILIAYNAGISYVKNGKMIPDETKNYIKKYWQLEEALCQEMSIPR